MPSFYIGIDLHHKVIQVCVLDGSGEPVGERRFEIEGLEEGLEVVDFLASFGPSSRLVQGLVRSPLVLCPSLEPKDNWTFTKTILTDLRSRARARKSFWDTGTTMPRSKSPDRCLVQTRSVWNPKNETKTERTEGRRAQ